MKKLLFLLFIAASMVCKSQQTSKTNVNENFVPIVVVSTFKQMYPNALVNGWSATHISYWYNDVSVSWYDNWYGARTIVAYDFQKPTYFQVDFTKEPGEYSRALYNLYGYWYETRTQIKGLPPKVLEGLAKTKYAEWRRSVHKERLEAAGWPSPIYRVNVTKGLRSQILRLDDLGNIVQVRELEED